LKIQDILEVYQLGEGLPFNYWDNSQLAVYPDEFTSDLNYNRSLKRMAQNIKSFRNTLNAKFVLYPQQTKNGSANYLTWIPINKDSLPKFSNDVENETLGVGVNELHLPQVFNKELVKLYKAIDELKKFLDVSNINPDSINKTVNCKQPFCWSFKAMSCYGLTLPIIKTCEINPITFSELQSGFPYTYAPSNIWGNAISDCCSQSNTTPISNGNIDIITYNGIISQ
jgi:hypothetical protein